MTKMLERMNKLKGRSGAELRFRGRQAIAAFSERHGLSSQSRLPTDAELFRALGGEQLSRAPGTPEELLNHFRSKNTSKFFAAFDDPIETESVLQDHFGKERQAVIETAESIIAGRFHLLGFDDLNFGQPIDWHLEPLSGKRTPLLHWSRIDELDSIESGDKKIVWELNRHQYFETLGRAYWFTGQERYAETFALHLAQWMDRNPPKMGLNWVSSLEVAFRAISWLWALHFFKDSSHLTPDLYKRALKYLYIHAGHLETFLSTYSSPNTHLTGEGLGLFYLGTLLPAFRDAARWRKQGREILIDELSRHVLSDGVYFERTSYYHRYTAEFYTHFLILAERNEMAVGNVVKPKLQALLDHLMFITRPDGTTPFVGDDDGGQLAQLDSRRVNDFRPLLSTGAALFYRAEYRHVAGEAAESTLWLLGKEGLRTFDEIEPRSPLMLSRAFPEGGYYVMRDGWTSDANYLLLDCGPHGDLGCGHSHADVLSFELVARGRTMLVDSGTFTYTGSKELRDYFRSSAAHNTLTIDGESSSVTGGPFSWKEIAIASVNAWKSDSRFDFLEGTHNGYKRLKSGSATHTRSVLFLKSDYWVMRDSIETEGSHHYEQHFHFAGGSHPLLEQTDGYQATPIESATGTPGLQIFSFADKGDWRIENGWVSTCYGERKSAPAFTFDLNGTGPQEIYSFLVPIRADEARAIVRELEITGGHAFEIRADEHYDLLHVGNGSLLKSGRITTDFKWAWTRHASDTENLEELVLIDGRSFTFDGIELLPSTEHVDYAVARRNGDKLIFEIDERVLEVDLPAAM